MDAIFFLIAIEIKCISLVENTAINIFEVFYLTTHLNCFGDHVFHLQRFLNVLYFSVGYFFLGLIITNNVIDSTNTKSVVP